MRVWLSLVLLIFAAPIAAQDQIIIPDDTQFTQDRPQGGTDLQMQAVTVQGQNQLRGRFGNAWTAEEVKGRASQTCASAGMRLIYFKPEEADAQGRTVFAAVCQ